MLSEAASKPVVPVISRKTSTGAQNELKR
jgi:hypothetical protein